MEQSRHCIVSLSHSYGGTNQKSRGIYSLPRIHPKQWPAGKLAAKLALHGESFSQLRQNEQKVQRTMFTAGIPSKQRPAGRHAAKLALHSQSVSQLRKKEQTVQRTLFTPKIHPKQWPASRHAAKFALRAKCFLF
jgi:hypothetical protein